MKAHTLLEFANKITPIECRLLAAEGGRCLTAHEIAKRSGMCKARALHISRQTSWLDCTVREIDAFMTACGITLKNRADAQYRLRTRTNLTSVRRSMQVAPRTRPYWKEIFDAYLSLKKAA